jgi:hypothetical protein
MARAAEVTPSLKHAPAAKHVVSELGLKLRRISEKITASGEKPLTRREIERELAERRGGLR